MERLYTAAFCLVAFRVGTEPIGDNSAFLHLRTGNEIANRGGIPRSDPFSFTANGADWLVQSWLPAWSYGMLQELGGVKLVVLEQGVLMAVLAGLVALLARTGSPRRTAAAAGIALGIGIPLWSPRPLLFGFIALALTILVVERSKSPWLLVPVAWFWVNSHGSFPLGVLWLGAVLVSEVIEREKVPRLHLAYMGSFLGGTVLAGLWPLGPSIVAFPWTVYARRELFSLIGEWKSPPFQSGPALFSLVFLVAALLILLRLGNNWRTRFTTVGFLAMGLLSIRNLPALGVVIAPALARSLRLPAPSVEAAVDSPSGKGPPRRLDRVVLAGIALVFVIFAAQIWERPAINYAGYPVRATDFLVERGLVGPDHRLAHEDTTGGYLIHRFGKDARVFVDDRFDMYPTKIFEDYVVLLRGEPKALQVLDDYRIDVVLWKKERPLATILSNNPDWRKIYDRYGWIIAVRRTPMPAM